MSNSSFDMSHAREVFGPDFNDAEIQELMAHDPREAFPHYFEGEDGQEELNVGAMTEVARIVWTPEQISACRAEMLR